MIQHGTIVEGAEFTISASKFYEVFPDAFTVSNPSPIFVLGGKRYRLQSAAQTNGGIRCFGIEAPDDIYS